MKKILKFLNDYLEETICIILMSVMTIIIFIQVIMRYVMHGIKRRRDPGCGNHSRRADR